MKIKHLEYKFKPKFGYGGVGGRYTIIFGMNQEIEAFKKIVEILQSLKNDFKGLGVRWDADVYQEKAYIHWDRKNTPEENKLIKEYNKEYNKKIKERERKEALKLAKKYKLIK